MSSNTGIVIAIKSVVLLSLLMLTTTEAVATATPTQSGVIVDMVKDLIESDTVDSTAEQSAEVDTTQTATDTEISNDQLNCLANNIYHEARGETVTGKTAVAYVTVNRTKSNKFPSTVCQVVKQGSRGRCQFSWTCDGKPDTIRDKASWQASLNIARKVLTGAVEDPTRGAIYFYNHHVITPKWVRTTLRTARIGNHTFTK